MSITPVTWQESLPNAVPEEKGSNTCLDKFGISLFSTTGRTCPGRLQGSAPHCVAGGALTHMFCWQISSLIIRTSFAQQSHSWASFGSVGFGVSAKGWQEAMWFMKGGKWEPQEYCGNITAIQLLHLLPVVYPRQALPG